MQISDYYKVNCDNNRHNIIKVINIKNKKCLNMGVKNKVINKLLTFG